MMKITLIYGTDTGNTRSIAKKIAKRLPDTSALHIAKARREDFENSDLLILGSPTCGFGELPEDWEKHLTLLATANLSGKTVALFGTADQLNYPGTFADALGILYDKAVASGATVIGQTGTEGYDFDQSAALRDGRFVGLVIDQDNQANQTEERITSWLGQIL